MKGKKENCNATPSPLYVTRKIRRVGSKNTTDSKKKLPHAQILASEFEMKRKKKKK